MRADLSSLYLKMSTEKNDMTTEYTNEKLKRKIVEKDLLLGEYLELIIFLTKRMTVGVSSEVLFSSSVRANRDNLRDDLSSMHLKMSRKKNDMTAGYTNEKLKKKIVERDLLLEEYLGIITFLTKRMKVEVSSEVIFSSSVKANRAI
jgi:hypothetical protein